MFDTTRGLTSRSTSPGKLSFFAWNIHGVISKTLGNKLQSSDFLSMINGSDFIFLTEPWKCIDVEVRGYRSIIKDAKVSKTGGRNSGGIVCCRKIYFMIGFQLSKHCQMFFGVQSTKDLPTQRKISTFVVFIFYRVAQNILTLNYLKN